MIYCIIECLFQDNLLAVVDEQALGGVVNTLTLQVIVSAILCNFVLNCLDTRCTAGLPNVD